MRLCKALDALEGFGGFSSLWQVWKALGSFDVNMVCPLPGSWINHVDANLIDFEDDWDKQCTEINVLFPQYFMLF